jgi:serine/threonine protein phosphatase PrpC
LEKERVRKAGGYISEGRINGNLNLSRAIGDLEYKKNTELKPSE